MLVAMAADTVRHDQYLHDHLVAPHQVPVIGEQEQEEQILEAAPGVERTARNS